MGLKSILIIFATVLFVGAFALVGFGIPETKHYGFNVSIAPDQERADVYKATFQVTSINDGKLIAAPTLLFRAGQPASCSVDGGSSASFKFDVSVMGSNPTAKYEIQVFDGKSLESKTVAEIKLAK